MSTATETKQPLQAKIYKKLKHWVSFDPVFEIGLRVLLVGFALLLLAASVIYGISVYLETQIVANGKKAWQIQEENLSLQAELNSLQAYESVSQMTTKLTGLKPAKDPINLNLNLKVLENQVQAAQEEMPKAAYVYGYGY